MSTVLDTLITDRTSADLAADLDKVYADYICLNRVEQACSSGTAVWCRYKNQGMEDGGLPYRCGNGPTARKYQKGKSGIFCKVQYPTNSGKDHIR